MRQMIAVCALSALVCGCALLEQPAERQLATYQRILTSATQIGATVDLRTHPGHRPAYEAAQQAVDSLRLSGNYDPQKLAEAIAKLPIREFKGQDGAWRITPAEIVLAWDALSGLFIEPATSPPWIKATLDGVSLGITRALAASPAAQQKMSEKITVAVPEKP